MTSRSDAPHANGWEKYQLMVLKELQTHSDALKKLDGDMVQLRVELATLKTRATIWGATAGAVPPIFVAVLTALLGN